MLKSSVPGLRLAELGTVTDPLAPNRYPWPVDPGTLVIPVIPLALLLLPELSGMEPALSMCQTAAGVAASAAVARSSGARSDTDTAARAVRLRITSIAPSVRPWVGTSLSPRTIRPAREGRLPDGDARALAAAAQGQ